MKSPLKRADELWSKVVRQKGYCEAAGQGRMRCNGRLEADHVIERNNYQLRHDLQNGLCLCSVHHRFWKEFRRSEFFIWFIKKFPQRWEYLKKGRLKKKKLNYQATLNGLERHEARFISKTHI